MITRSIGWWCLGVERRTAGALNPPSSSSSSSCTCTCSNPNTWCFHFTRELSRSLCQRGELRRRRRSEKVLLQVVGPYFNHHFNDRWLVHSLASTAAATSAAAAAPHRIGANLLRDPRVSKQLICLAGSLWSWQRICLCQVNFASEVSIRREWMRRKHLTRLTANEKRERESESEKSNKLSSSTWEEPDAPSPASFYFSFFLFHCVNEKVNCYHFYLHRLLTLLDCRHFVSLSCCTVSSAGRLIILHT